MFQGGETEFCERIRKIYGKGVMYMLQVISPRAEEWRSIVKAIATLIEEASFEFSPEGIKLRSMDPSHIALVNLNGLTQHLKNMFVINNIY